MRLPFLIPILILCFVSNVHSLEVENSGFEDGVIGWSYGSTSGTNCSFTIDSDAYEGVNAAKLNIANRGYCMLHNQNSIAVDTTSRYSIRLRGKAVGSAIDHLHLGVFKALAPDSFPTISVGWINITEMNSQYDLYQLHVDLVEGEYIRLELGFENSSDVTSGFVLFDAIEIVNTYADDDNDGVINVYDDCLETPVNSVIYSNGCAAIRGDLNDNQELDLGDTIGILRVLTEID